MGRVGSWLLGLLIAIVALGAIVFVVGLMIPAEDETVVSITLAAPPHVVWQVLTDYAALGSWQPQYARTELTTSRSGSQPARWRAVFKDGYVVNFEETEYDAPRRLVNKIADKNLPFGGSWTMVLTPVQEGTHLTLISKAELPNPFLRIAAKLLARPRPILENVLHELKKKVEVGNVRK
jgi:uncharacterized protein YndB with AHSA1/START domain